MTSAYQRHVLRTESVAEPTECTAFNDRLAGLAVCSLPDGHWQPRHQWLDEQTGKVLAEWPGDGEPLNQIATPSTNPVSPRAA